MKLTCFNQEKIVEQQAPDKEKALEEHKRKQEEAMKLVERE
jgi:hypothetical protein